VSVHEHVLVDDHAGAAHDCHAADAGHHRPKPTHLLSEKKK